MSAREWTVLFWIWLVLAFVWMALDASIAAKYGTLMAAIVARGIGDILAAIERTNPAQPVVKGAREKA